MIEDIENDEDDQVTFFGSKAESTFLSMYDSYTANELFELLYVFHTFLMFVMQHTATLLV